MQKISLPEFLCRKNSVNIRILKLAFIFLLFFPSTPHAKTFNAESFTLDNGLHVVIIPNSRAPVVTHMVWYKVGAADEPQGLSGMAHYFEHLMFKGTQTLAPGEFSRTVKKLGGNDNAFTGQDYTAYYQNIATEHLEKMMMMEADRMTNLNVPAAHFVSEKKVVLEERRQRTENDPHGLFFEQMRSALFINHPYGTPVIGWMDEIKGYEWEDVKKFYDTWYAPNNAIVIISGDVTADVVRPMATRTYGALKPKKLPPRLRAKVPPAISDTLMTLHHESINQPVFYNMRLAPNSHENKTHSLALQVLQEVLSGGPITRLYKNLVVDQKKAINIGFSFNGNALDYGTITFSGTPAENVTLDELQNLIEAEFQKVMNDGITQEELKNAIQRLQDAAIYARDSLQGPANVFGSTLATGGHIDDVENWPDDIAAVTIEQVQGVAKTYLDPENLWHRRSITGHLLPLKKTEQTKIEENKEGTKK